MAQVFMFFLLLSLTSVVSVRAESSNEELLARMEDLEREVKDLKAQLQAKEVSTSVAFSARLDGNQAVGTNTVLFSILDLNTGSGYDPFSGIFSPPVTGIYTFNLYARGNSVDGPMYIYKNNDILCNIWVTNPDGESASCTAKAFLQDGDTARVTGGSQSARIYGSFSGFSGHLISETATP